MRIAVKKESTVLDKDIVFSLERDIGMKISKTFMNWEEKKYALTAGIVRGCKGTLKQIYLMNLIALNKIYLAEGIEGTYIKYLNDAFERCHTILKGYLRVEDLIDYKSVIKDLERYNKCADAEIYCKPAVLSQLLSSSKYILDLYSRIVLDM